jgi:hypothetical protein
MSEHDEQLTQEEPVEVEGHVHNMEPAERPMARSGDDAERPMARNDEDASADFEGHAFRHKPRQHKPRA